MENTMTFLNSHFTWLEASRRSLPRPKRLQRSRLPRQKKKKDPFPCPENCKRKMKNNQGDAGDAGNRILIF